MISYIPITKDRYAEAADFIIHHFYPHEPFGLALGLTLDQVTRWFPTFLAKLLDSTDPVSFLAVNSENGEIAGCVINEIVDPAQPPLPSMKDFIDPETEPVKEQITTFLEHLEKGVDVRDFLNQPSSSKVLACVFLTVSESYAKQGIARGLALTAEEAAKKIPGVTIAMTDTTSFYSYKVFLALNYKLMKEMDYISYQDPEGHFIFEGKEKLLGVHTHARVLAKLI